MSASVGRGPAAGRVADAPVGRVASASERIETPRAGLDTGLDTLVPRYSTTKSYSTTGNAHVAVDVVALEEELVSRGIAPSADVAEYALWLGDDALILAQRLGWWISRAPELEEDVALANIALDLLGHARSLLHYAGTALVPSAADSSHTPRSEDDLAYWREASEFRSVHLVEQPNGDFAHTIVRQLIVSYYLFELYLRLQASADATLAAIAAKAVKEVDYHRDHARQWMLRLALGTDESRARLQTALADLWPYVDELFRDTPLIDRLGVVEGGGVEGGGVESGGVAVRPSSLREPFDAALADLFAECELEVPRGPIARGGGRDGVHSEYLQYILSEMQWLTRQHPGATW
ncbi:1,2-phenylacetyl-CoA epoxidase subunit PaaC [Rathayibacter soli]|uniref:1,2-phenylacetyl-CoA epoxidase subunit PaaC n=1 Tax=Rathayibacter soli TaxID=3144168 RepID=UPI0027E5330B|nr:1,2-phenylacetyl-CoA epoxidase subunit PaaC [Glaciibacter superstes]